MDEAFIAHGAIKKYGKHLTGVAFHEAGHAALGLFYKLRVKSVTIVPDGDGSLGSTEHFKSPSWLRYELNSSGISSGRVELRVYRTIMRTWAGIKAEKLATGGRNNHAGAASDYEGIDDLVSRASANLAETTVLMKWLEVRTVAALQYQWNLRVEPIALALLERKTLSRKDVHAVVVNRHNQITSGLIPLQVQAAEQTTYVVCNECGKVRPCPKTRSLVNEACRRARCDGLYREVGRNNGAARLADVTAAALGDVLRRSDA